MKVNFNVMRVAINWENTEASSGTRIPGIVKILKSIVLFTRFTFIIGLLFLLAGYEDANPKIGNTTVEFFSAEFRSGVENSLLAGTDAHDMDILLHEFYKLRKNMPAWTLNFEVNEDYRKLHSLIISAADFGLVPAQYSLKKLDHLENSLIKSHSSNSNIKERIEFELTATQAALRFMLHLSAGFREEDTTASYRAIVASLPVYLNTKLGENELTNGILQLQPKSKEYRRLQKALRKYLNQAGSDSLYYSFEELSTNDSLVGRRLCMQGFLDKGFMYDSVAIRSAIENFQRAHNLEISGEPNTKTLAALTLNTKNKFNKIALNLDRLRKDELNTKNYVLVNIPEFKLHYYSQAGEYHGFNVVVGRTYTPTPLLTSYIERIIANPYWTVPKSITFNEFIPKIKQDSLYLQKHGYSVIDKFENPIEASAIDWNNIKRGEFDYWIRQPNGGRNALGVVKFLFPNKYSVYLHDTQSKKLFNRQVRAYSHGCVRVQNPEELAQYILKDYYKTSTGDEVDFNQIVSKKDRVELRLDESLPVYIRYYTCTADSLGNIFYHPDIYKKDAASMEEIMAYISSN